MPRWLVPAGCLITMLVALSCSPSHQPVAPGVNPAQDHSGLPGLSSLAFPTRQVEMLAPGYYALSLDEELASAAAIPAPGSLHLSAVAGMAWAVYGVYGFDGDNGPVSAKLTLSSISGEYFIGFSNYHDGVWVFAGPFTASAEVAIPNPDGLRLPDAFVSSNGAGYLAVVASKGSSLTVSALELGVQGGVESPAPPGEITASGGEGMMLLNWLPSADQARPDFAGYRVERAELLAGDFAPLLGSPVASHFCQDATAVAGQLYRYRVSAVDASGNTSPWITAECGPVAGELPNPVAILKLPANPLAGPAEAQVSLHESFDPAGVGINQYALDFGEMVEPVSGAEPTWTVDLPPGCYQVTAVVTTSDGREGRSLGRLFVQPQWMAAPVTVRETTTLSFPGQSRLDHLRGVSLPSGGVLLAGEDRTMDSLSCWHGSPTNLKLLRLPLTSGIDYLGEPVIAGERVYLPFSQGANFYIAAFEDDQAVCTLGPPRTDATLITAASDGSALWLIYGQDNAGSIDLQCTGYNAEPSSAVLAAGIGGVSALDAVYNPVKHALEIVYSDNDSTEWLEWSVVSQTLMDSITLALISSPQVDIELDPSTGLPGVVIAYNSRQHYYEQQGDFTWTSEELIDDSENNYFPFDLYIANGRKLCYFALGSGQAYLYERSAPGTWVRAATPTFSTDSAYNTVLLAPATGSLALVQVVDVASDGKVYLADFNQDGTDTLVTAIQPGCGQGYELHAAAAQDGLHAIWRGNLDQEVQHYASNDGGTSWDDAGMLGNSLSHLDLASTSDGELYLSAFDGANNVLSHWNGGGWDTRWWIGSDGNGRAFLGGSSGTAVRWVSYEPWSGTIHYIGGTEAGGYSDSTAISSARPIWTGAVDGGGISGSCFTLTSGATRDTAWLGLYNYGEGQAQLAAEFSPLGLASFSTPQVTLGRELACVDYTATAGAGPNSCGVCFTGPSGRPLLCDLKPGSPVEIAELPLGDWLAGDAHAALNQEARRTVSCAAAAGGTGVMLISSWDGAERYFAWSGFGDWQTLPLPAGPAEMAAPQIVVGMDGRWHIIYKDWRTDSIMCWSTE